jgi:hypothetical protein
MAERQARRPGHRSTVDDLTGADVIVADGGRWRMLPVILIGSFLSFLDLFIVDIALPAMQTDLEPRRRSCNSSWQRMAWGSG